MAPGGAIVSDEVPVSYAKAVGARLRSLRRQRGLSLLAVEDASGREFKASVLGAYERGERVISVLRLQRLAALYRVPVDQLLPRSPGPAPGEGPADFVPRRPLAIDLAQLDATESIEGQVIRRYVNSIRSQRAVPPGALMPIRAEDLAVMARFFDRDETSMEMRLVELGLRA
jgi:transcriptional regulator with XRE-family HTH domain